MNRLVVLILVVVGAWFFREPLEDLWERVQGVVPRVRTEMDMRGFKEPLRVHIERKGGPPDDVAAWLDENNPPQSPGQRASQDRYGNEYQLTRDRETGNYVLRSCGADEECYSDDDILVDIVAN